MDKRDRVMIDRFCNEFLSEINIYSLFPCLLKFGVFNEDDVNVPVWKKTLSHPDTVRDIVETVKTRGPYAFQNLIESLRRTNHGNLADILARRDDNSWNNNVPVDIDDMPNESDDLPHLDDKYHEVMQITKKPLQIKVRKSTTFKDEPDYRIIGSYPMRTKPHGYVLIITIINYALYDKRDAAELDQANLTKLFEEMGFEVTSYTDLTGAGIKGVVKEFSERKDFHKVSSSFVIISAHGTEKPDGLPDTEIQGIDYQLPEAAKVYCDDIIDYFTAEKCNRLAGKPKIFIFQACRGSRHQHSVIRSTTDGIPGINSRNTAIRNYSDILVAHSTMSGYYAYRDKLNGSWYIQLLCEVFMNYAHEMHVQDLFNMVDKRLKDLRTEHGEAQTSTVKSIGFNKHCFLNPGLFES